MQKSIISSLLIFWSILCFGQGIKEIQAPGEFEFNTTLSFGALSQEYELQDDGSKEDTKTYLYNTSGDLIKILTSRDGPDENYKYDTLIYDQNGILKSQIAYTISNGVAYRWYTYKYDSYDNLIQVVDSWSNGRLEYQNYSYDARNNVTRHEFVGSQLTILYVNKYDAQNNLIEQKYAWDGQYDWIRNYEYNELGQRITEKYTDLEYDRSWTGEYTYDEENNLILYLADSVSLVSSGGETFAKSIRIVYQNDSKGRKVKEHSTEEWGGNVYVRSIIDYEYDENGNITELINDRGGDGSWVEHLKYFYYNSGNCASVGSGLEHQFEVNIPEDGNWTFELCGSSFRNVLALSEVSTCKSDVGLANSGCELGDARLTKELTAGEYYLTVAGSGVADKGEYKLNIYKEGGLGIGNTQRKNLDIYPNPVNSVLTIETDIAVGTVNICDAWGRQVLKENKDTRKSIDVQSLRPGIYFITLTDGANTYQSKFIKQ